MHFSSCAGYENRKEPPDRDLTRYDDGCQRLFRPWKFYRNGKLQLCLAYTYGDGKEKSCENTVRAVSRLFYGMPVAAYAALDLDAIAVLTDAVGGVEVTVTKDLTIQDPSLKEGERKVLTGEQAQWYVRSRLVEEKEATADANSDRIERQKQYLAAFGGKAAEQFRKNPLFC